MKSTLNQKNSRIFEAILGSILYTSIMGIGMLVMHSFFRLEYNQPDMVYVIGAVEVILTFVVVFMVNHFFDWNEVGFEDLDLKQFIWFVPHGLIIGIMGMVFFSDLSKCWGQLEFAQQELLVAIGLTTLLVGVSEEIMYRGIVLNSVRVENRKFWGVMMSSICFSLLHSVNVLGGLSLEEMTIQLVNTFLLGFCFANFALRLKNIVPLIIFHWFWDFILIGSAVINSQAKEFALYAFPVNIIIGLIMWITYKHTPSIHRIRKEYYE